MTRNLTRKGKKLPNFSSNDWERQRWTTQQLLKGAKQRQVAFLEAQLRTISRQCFTLGTVEPETCINGFQGTSQPLCINSIIKVILVTTNTRKKMNFKYSIGWLPLLSYPSLWACTTLKIVTDLYLDRSKSNIKNFKDTWSRVCYPIWPITECPKVATRIFPA